MFARTRPCPKRSIALKNRSRQPFGSLAPIRLSDRSLPAGREVGRYCSRAATSQVFPAHRRHEIPAICRRRKSRPQRPGARNGGGRGRSVLTDLTHAMGSLLQFQPICREALRRPATDLGKHQHGQIFRSPGAPGGHSMQNRSELIAFESWLRSKHATRKWAAQVELHRLVRREPGSSSLLSAIAGRPPSAARAHWSAVFVA